MSGSSARAVVCFAGPRDHYEGAAALAESGQLERLVTDAYSAHRPGMITLLVASVIISMHVGIR
jgi:hypothetical protein